MHRFRKLDALKKPALIVGMLLTFVLGLANLPEVALRLYPDSFLEGKLHRVRRNMIKVYERIDSGEATLSVLDQERRKGFPRFFKGPYPSDTGMEQAIRRMKGREVEDYGELSELDYMRRRLEALRK